jgi:hypothetical protein
VRTVGVLTPLGTAMGARLVVANPPSGRPPLEGEGLFCTGFTALQLVHRYRLRCAVIIVEQGDLK